MANVTARDPQKSCLIVGAGLSGLVAANHLQSEGFRVTIIDKGRGIGGRLATRRIKHPQDGKGVFDYGVQYLTARSPEFKEWIDSLRNAGVVEPWSCGSRYPEDLLEQKYRGIESTRSIAQYLASNTDIKSRARVVKLGRNDAGWTVSVDDGSEHRSDIVILTPPLPQTLLLLKKSEISLPESISEKLSQVLYNMCLTVLVLLSGPTKIAQSGGLPINGKELDWIACNHTKGISPDCYAVTLHAGPNFSDAYSERNRWDEGAKRLIELSKEHLGSNIEILVYQTHLWKYSAPINPFNAPFFALQDLPNSLNDSGSLFLAGDGFSSHPDQKISSVEGAYLSGLKVSQHVCDEYCVGNHAAH
ncbi:MAG: FAD-dependent oxidoreductase [Cyanobacteria bacterium P01_F01_bin.42]